MAELAIGPVDALDSLAVSEVIELGNRGSATLGHLPYAAYEDAARRGWITVARDGGGTIVAFALFRLSSRWIGLTQLYVEPNRRHQGIGRALVDWISDRYHAYPGIRVKCRQDYGLAPAWIAMGFARGIEVPGRGRDHRPLAIWWRNHNHARLFDWNRPEVLVRASVDFNVLRDLDDPSRPGHAEALALVDDQLWGVLELVRTGELDVELERLGDDASRARCARRAQDFEATTAPAHAVADCEAALLASIPASFAANESGRRDVRYVSEAVAAGLPVFVTQDRDLARILGPWAEGRGVRVLTPSDTVVHMDELTDARAYQPASVGDTAYLVQRLGIGSDDRLLSLANPRAGEAAPALRRRIKDLTARGVGRYGVAPDSGPLAAAYLVSRFGDGLDVAFLRAADGPLSDTLLRQLLFRLRSEARDLGLAYIRISDPHLPPSARTAALDDGFLPLEGALVALVLDTCAPAAEVNWAACLAARAAGVPEPASVATSVPEVVALAERAWWPAKFVDGPLSTYLVPIQQRFATPLLGYPAGLFARDDVLGLRREHVYYRSAVGAQPKAPGRILWYASGTRGRSPAPAGIVGCSSLDSVVVGEPEAVYERFRHLGVWRRDQVLEAAGPGRVVQALHFSGTEVFPTTVTLGSMRAMGVEHPMAPRLVAQDIFAALYHAGQRRG